MKKIQILTSGESHGQKLTAIISGLPVNFAIDIEKINKNLELRQDKANRGDRQKIESDSAIITSGLHEGKTTGAPLNIEIINNDYSPTKNVKNQKPRPGHADYFGMKKYDFDDINIVIERASARKTAIDVAVGSIFMQILEKLNISIESSIIKIGEDTYIDQKQYSQIVNQAKKDGDTLGGEIRTTIKNLPLGVGSYIEHDRKLDALISTRVMAINTIKGIFFGEEITSGLKYIDELSVDENRHLSQDSNRAGGIIGGMSTGDDIFFKTFIKPIPTTGTPLKTVEIDKNMHAKATYIRSDVCALNSICIIISCETAVAIFDEILNSLKVTENFEELKKDKLWQ